MQIYNNQAGNQQGKSGQADHRGQGDMSQDNE